MRKFIVPPIDKGREENPTFDKALCIPAEQYIYRKRWIPLLALQRSAIPHTCPLWKNQYAAKNFTHPQIRGIEFSRERCGKFPDKGRGMP